MSTIQQAESAAFVEMICADPDLLRAEFDELIASFWSEEPPAGRPSPWREGLPAEAIQIDRAKSWHESRLSQTGRSRQRSPPPPGMHHP